MSNKSFEFTGATMVYKFLQGLDELYDECGADDYLDMVALGMISDMADTTDPEIQYLIRKGIKNIQNPMLQALFDKQSFTTNGVVNQITFSFNIIPLINASTRIATYDEMKLIVDAFCNIETDRIFEYIPSRGNNKGEILEETLYESVARLLVSLKGKQDRMVKKILEGSKRPPQKGLFDILDESHKNKKILLIDATNFMENNGGLTGLLANKIMYRYNKPTLLFSKKENGTISGSGRGEQIDLFKSKLSQNNYVTFAQGHEPAFGFKLETIGFDINKVEESLFQQFKNEISDAQYIVDFSIPSSMIEDYMIEDLCQLEDYFGSGLKQPLIHVYDICVDSSLIDTGKDENKLSFYFNDIEFIMFKPSPEKLEELVDWSNILCYNLIGRPNINTYDGERKVQIIIEAIERIKSESVSQDNSEDWNWDNSESEVEAEDDFEW